MSYAAQLGWVGFVDFLGRVLDGREPSFHQLLALIPEAIARVLQGGARSPVGSPNKVPGSDRAFLSPCSTATARGL
jgi:hypothetical protein